MFINLICYCIVNVPKYDNKRMQLNDYILMNFFLLTFRRNTELTAESIKHLEKVFRENLAKDKDEFTLSEFKKIVPSKNVSVDRMKKNDDICLIK